MTDLTLGSYMLYSIVWFFAGVGIGYILRDVKELAKAYSRESQ